MYNHYLPASFLSLFSIDSTTDRRKRTLYIGDFEKRDIYKSVASHCGGEEGLYVQSVEDFWHLYEPGLAKSIEKLISGDISFYDWVHILVPFVTSLFVRSPTYNSLFDNRLLSIQTPTQYITYENTNRSRIFEMQRLLAPVLSATWIILHTTGDSPLVVNDIGYIPFINPTACHKGWAIPLGLAHILVLVPTRYRILASFIQNQWVPNIQYIPLSKENNMLFNITMSKYSRRFIFGGDKSVIDNLLSIQNGFPMREFETMFPISNLKLIQYELSWFKLVKLANLSYDQINSVGISNIKPIKPFISRINPMVNHLPSFFDPFRIKFGSLYTFML